MKMFSDALHRLRNRAAAKGVPVPAQAGWQKRPGNVTLAAPANRMPDRKQAKPVTHGSLFSQALMRLRRR